jgi:hypothetical protein
MAIGVLLLYQVYSVSSIPPDTHNYLDERRVYALVIPPVLRALWDARTTSNPPYGLLRGTCLHGFGQEPVSGNDSGLSIISLIPSLQFTLVWLLCIIKNHNKILSASNLQSSSLKHTTF